MPRPTRTDGKRPGTRRLDTPSKNRKAAVDAGLTKEVPVGNIGVKNNSGEPGRIKLELNEIVLYAMAKSMVSYDVLGEMFGVSGQFIVEKPEYKEIVEAARADRKRAISDAQLTAATIDRNPTMLIWLGKIHLGQAERSTERPLGLDGKPVENAGTETRVVAYMPDNGRDKPSVPTTPAA